LVVIQAQALVHQMKCLADELHVPVLDPVVDHLYKMAGARLADLNIKLQHQHSASDDYFVKCKPIHSTALHRVREQQFLGKWV
jgi:hypothetical protein